MKFIFVCPEYHQLFETNEFHLVDDKGIVTDTAGNRYLDANIVVDSPCPYCGKHHVIHANDMICPFQGMQKDSLTNIIKKGEKRWIKG